MRSFGLLQTAVAVALSVSLPVSSYASGPCPQHVLTFADLAEVASKSESKLPNGALPQVDEYVRRMALVYACQIAVNFYSASINRHANGINLPNDLNAVTETNSVVAAPRSNELAAERVFGNKLFPKMCGVVRLPALSEAMDTSARGSEVALTLRQLESSFYAPVRQRIHHFEPFIKGSTVRLMMRYLDHDGHQLPAPDSEGLQEVASDLKQYLIERWRQFRSVGPSPSMAPAALAGCSGLLPQVSPPIEGNFERGDLTNLTMYESASKAYSKFRAFMLEDYR